MKNKGLTIYGIVTLCLMALANVAHAFWTVTVISEYVASGGAVGIAMAFAAVFTLITEAACLPILIATVVYFALHKGRRSRRGVLIANVALTALLLLQAALTLSLIFL